jgi:hypothetical protein
MPFSVDAHGVYCPPGPAAAIVLLCRRLLFVVARIRWSLALPLLFFPVPEQKNSFARSYGTSWRGSRSRILLVFGALSIHFPLLCSGPTLVTDKSHYYCTFVTVIGKKTEFRCQVSSPSAHPSYCPLTQSLSF